MDAVAYRKVDVDGINIFYREAGPKQAPTILLLHGFPTAGHMFRDLIPELPGGVGKGRSFLPAAGCRGVQTRHSRCDDSFLRYGPLRA
jgi:pimeloyl-ACP methyl ester carboxylesterase